MMKKAGYFLFSFFIFISFLLVLGPRVEIDPELKLQIIPTDVEAFVTQSESLFQDITPNTEKKIIWHGEPNNKTEYAVVFIHGFGASRQELTPVPENLASQLNANYFGTRLQGHGRPGKFMGTPTVNDWINDVAQAVEVGRRIGNKVIVICNSTGCSSMAYLITLPEFQDLAAVIFASPNFGPRNKLAEVALFPWALQIGHIIEGETREWEPQNDLQAKYYTTKQPTKAVLPMMGLVQLARNADHEKSTVPILLIYSPQDKVVDTDLVQEYCAKYTNSKVIKKVIENTGDNSNHVLAGDIHAPENNQVMQKMIVSFIEKTL